MNPDQSGRKFHCEEHGWCGSIPCQYCADRDQMSAAEAFQRAHEWASGARSHMNTMQAMEASPEQRQQTLVAVAQADAAEAAKWSSYAAALAQKEALRVS